MPPSRDTSAIISLVLFLTTLGGIGYFADLLASTSQLTIVGGFLSSLLFFFGLTAIGNLESETGWFEVIFCLFVAVACAAYVHRVCATTCLLFSFAELYWMNAAAAHQNAKGN